jgi:hypothetical protein
MDDLNAMLEAITKPDFRSVVYTNPPAHVKYANLDEIIKMAIASAASATSAREIRAMYLVTLDYTDVKDDFIISEITECNKSIAELSVTIKNINMFINTLTDIKNAYDSMFELTPDKIDMSNIVYLRADNGTSVFSCAEDLSLFLGSLEAKYKDEHITHEVVAIKDLESKKLENFLIFHSYTPAESYIRLYKSNLAYDKAICALDDGKYLLMFL